MEVEVEGKMRMISNNRYTLKNDIQMEILQCSLVYEWKYFDHIYNTSRLRNECDNSYECRCRLNLVSVI